MAVGQGMWDQQIRSTLSRDHGAIQAFTELRRAEEPDLDSQKLSRGIANFVTWTPRVAEATQSSLARRGWGITRQRYQVLLENEYGDLRLRPTVGTSNVPALLRSSVYIVAYAVRLDTAFTLLDGDIVSGLEAGGVMLGADRARAILDDVDKRLSQSAEYIAEDIETAGPDSMSVEPGPVTSFQHHCEGTRDLTAVEKPLVGQWVWHDYYRSGDFSMRIELYLVLTPGGHCAMTSKASSSSSLRNTDGSWRASLDAVSGLTGDERGTWSYNANRLRLVMSNGKRIELRVEDINASEMRMVNTADGEARYWTRG